MADAVTLKKTLAARCTTYDFQNGKPMGCVSFAQMLSNTVGLYKLHAVDPAVDP
jgi:20S proteasome subunit beta 6